MTGKTHVVIGITAALTVSFGQPVEKSVNNSISFSNKFLNS